MVGAIDGIEYHEHTLTLDKGDTLVMFTDGITEAMNAQLQEFGEDRLVATLEKLTQSNCQQVVEGIKADVADFVGEAEQSDDITVLAVKRV